MPLYAQDDIKYKDMMRQAVNNGNYNYAMQVFTAAEEDDYYDIESLQRIVCEILYATKQYDQALSLSKKLYDIEENSNLSDIILMSCLAKQGSKNDSLIAEITQKLTQSQFDKNILMQLQLISKSDIDKISAAVSRYIVEKKIEDKEELKTYKTFLTLLFFTNGHYTDAYNASVDYLTMDEQPVIYYILGILRQKRQEYTSAISFFTMAIKNGYTHYDAYLQRAICYGWEKDYIRSDIDLDTCLMIDSNYYVFYLKGINSNHMRNYQDAMLYFDYSITLNDTFADSYNYRGIVSSNTGEYEFAVNDFKRAIYLNKKTPFVHNNLGIALEKTGKTEEAIKEFNLSINYEPYLSDAYYNLGRIYTQRHENSKAIRFLQRAAELDPDIPDTYYLLGMNYQEKGNKEKACKMYTDALNLGHTQAQNKIDNYCNKEEEKPQESEIKYNPNRRTFYEDDESDQDYSDTENDYPDTENDDEEE